ncbi:MAG: diguanylate cyclase [Dethiosulfatibacter sp.]|nr:diguanylate cyclase [Dethiosulfatibacter sp.]
MNSKNDKSQEVNNLKISGEELRKQAERIIEKGHPGNQRNLGIMFSEEIEKILHELQVHQIELEMQNDELRVKQMELDAARARYYDIYDLAPVGYCTLSVSSIIIEANQTAGAMLGIRRTEMVKQPFFHYIINDDQDIYYLSRKKLLETGDPQEWEMRMLRHDSEIIWVQITANLAQDEDGQSVFRVVMQDITKRKQVEKQLAIEKEQFETTLMSVGDGVISVDCQGSVKLMNKIAEQLTGWNQMEAQGKPLGMVFNAINGFTKERCPEFESIAQRIGEKIQSDDDTILISLDNTEKPINYNISLIKDADGNSTGAVLVFSDFTEKKQRQEEINYLSFHDHLTGLYNRRYYEEELIRLDTPRNLPLTIVMADINSLKLVNDSFGHAMGDEMLKKAAEVIKQGCRDDDIISRIGGDEFVILLPKTDSIEAKKIIKRIKYLLSEVKIGLVEISISFGYETKRNQEDKIHDIFKKAEDFMYSNKLYESTKIKGKTITAILGAFFARNQQEQQHSRNVSELCRLMGEAMQLSDFRINELKTLGLLHDIGKIAIDENLLVKTDKLTSDELNEIKSHTEIGYRLLRTVNEMSKMAVEVLHHHERWDGDGYPEGLKGEEISLESRIIAIAECYDAMTSTIGSPDILSSEDAIKELLKNAGGQFDSDLVKIFIEKILEKK